MTSHHVTPHLGAVVLFVVTLIAFVAETQLAQVFHLILFVPYCRSDSFSLSSLFRPALDIDSLSFYCAFPPLVFY